jgi:ribosomal protein S18 acetylase RimI-like enzyme
VSGREDGAQNQEDGSEDVSDSGTALPGQETLLASWTALAETSPQARVTRSATSTIAVFPAWEPLNNAIVSDSALAAASPIAAELAAVYTAAGVDGWALWLPSRTPNLDAPDDIIAVDGLNRDTTTLVMRAPLRPGLSRHDGVLRASVVAAALAGDEPVAVADLGDPETSPGLAAWVLVQDGDAVAGAWSFRHGTDCGIYAVGTAPTWRRRGLATVLMQHVLAVAEQDGARTATLQSTPMAQGLYESLGFVAVGRYEEWVPQ